MNDLLKQKMDVKTFCAALVTIVVFTIGVMSYVASHTVAAGDWEFYKTQVMNSQQQLARQDEINKSISFSLGEIKAEIHLLRNNISTFCEKK